MSHDAQVYCENFSRIVWLLLSNELPAEEAERWKEHLLRCSSCQQEMVEIESTLKAYKTVPDGEPAQAAIEAVLAEAQKGVEVNQENLWSPFKDAFRFNRVWRPVLAAATLAAMVLVASNESGRRALGIRSFPELIHQAEQKRDLDPIARGLRDLRKRIGIHGLAEYIEDPQGFPRPDPEADPIYRRVRALRRALGIKGLPELIEDARKNA